MAPKASGSESTEELLAHLARVSGRTIRTREDIDDYVAWLSRNAKARRTKSQHLKNILLAALLLATAAQYYFIDVQLQILAQPTLTVFVPVKDAAGNQKPYI